MFKSAMMIVSTALLLGGWTSCQEIQDEDPSWLKYQHILRASTAEWNEREPFLVKVEYQLFDLAGNPGVKGTIEEQWGYTENPHFSIQSPSLKIDGTESAEASVSKNTRENYLVHQAIHAIVRPFPSVMHKKDFVMDQFEQDFGGVSLDCFSLVPPSVRNAATPSYCTDADGRLTILAGDGPFVLRRSDLRKFREHFVPMDITVIYGGKTALTAHVLEFDTLQADKTVESTVVTAKDGSVVIPGEFIAGRRLKAPQPKYPGKAKAAHIVGTVVLIGVITKDGTIAGLDVLSSPDPMLSKAATDAVEKWTYTPYLLKGQVTSVDTTISVNFNIGR